MGQPPTEQRSRRKHGHFRSDPLNLGLLCAAGDRIIARGKVVKAGRTLTLAQTEVFAEKDGRSRLIALLAATLMAVEGRDGLAD